MFLLFYLIFCSSYPNQSLQKNEQKHPNTAWCTASSNLQPQLDSGLSVTSPLSWSLKTFPSSTTNLSHHHQVPLLANDFASHFGGKNEIIRSELPWRPSPDPQTGLFYATSLYPTRLSTTLLARFCLSATHISSPPSFSHHFFPPPSLLTCLPLSAPLTLIYPYNKHMTGNLQAYRSNFHPQTQILTCSWPTHERRCLPHPFP